MLTSKFKDFLAYIKNKKILITTHDLVDIDGLVSCFTLREFLKNHFKDQEITLFFPEFSKSTKSFVNKFSERFPEFNLSYEKEFNESKADVLLIVDTNKLDPS